MISYHFQQSEAVVVIWKFIKRFQMFRYFILIDLNVHALIHSVQSGCISSAKLNKPNDVEVCRIVGNNRVSSIYRKSISPIMHHRSQIVGSVKAVEPSRVNFFVSSMISRVHVIPNDADVIVAINVVVHMKPTERMNHLVSCSSRPKAAFAHG